MPFTLQQINQFEMAGTPLVAEVEPHVAHTRAWVVVYPPKPATGFPCYTVQRIGIPVEFLIKGWDIHEEDMTEMLRFKCESLKDVEQRLSELGLTDTAALAVPWKSDAPV